MDKNLHDLTHSIAESLGDIVYNAGWKDGWESAKTVCNIWANTTDKECEEMFGFSNIFNIFNNFSASEIEEKFKTWEAEHKNTYSNCNTCNHKNEDVICYDCVNNSEYEDEPEQTEKREPKQTEKSCGNCRHLVTDGYSTFCSIRAVDDCVNKDKWEPKQPKRQPKRQPERSCASCAREHENCRAIYCHMHNLSYWIPKQTDDQINNDQIKLGDEVIHETGSKGIVVGIDSENFYLLTSDYDMLQKVSKEGYTKTGRYFPQIQELRDQLR